MTSETTFTIRKAVKEDAPRIVEVINKAYSRDPCYIDSFRRIDKVDEISDLIQNNSYQFYLLISPERELCGTICLNLPQGKFSHFSMSSDRPEYKGKGGLLLKRVESAASVLKIQKLGFATLSLAGKLIQYYKDNGYTEVSRTPARDSWRQNLKPEFRDTASWVSMSKSI